MTRYLCTVDVEVIHADSEAEAMELMRERMKLGAVVVSWFCLLAVWYG